MLEKLLPYEQELFFLINSSHSPFLDQVMWLYSGLFVWIPFILFFLFMLTYKKKRKEWLPAFLFLSLAVILSVAFSSLITKPYFARPRPIYYPDIMEQVRTLYENILDPYGFISGHSASAFSIAIFTVLLFRKKIYTWVIFFWALGMAYSRIYLGVHFISDILAGGMAGTLIGYLIYLLYRWYVNRPSSAEKGIVIATYTDRQINTIAIVLISYIILFTVMGGLLSTF